MLGTVHTQFYIREFNNERNIFAEGFLLANNDDVLHYKKMAYLKGQCHKILDPRFVTQFLLMWDHNSCAQAFSQKVSISQRCLHLVNLR